MVMAAVCYAAGAVAPCEFESHRLRFKFANP